MRRRSLVRTAIGVATLILLGGMKSSPCQAQPVLLESAQLGAPGQVGGTAVGTNLYVGWRFETSVPVAVEQVGGHMYAIPDQPGDIFAALVRLPSLTSMPEGSPFTETELVAETTFRPNFPSDNFLTPLSATLIPGSYALVFGSGLFDAVGGAGLVNGSDQPYILPTSKSSYLSWQVPTPGSPPMWLPAQAENMRFVVVGQETNFTADFEDDGDVDGADLSIWQSAFGKNALGDADEDNDSDGRDFLAWQRQYTGPAGAASSSTPLGSAMTVPEPATGWLLALFALSLSCSASRMRN